jgi:hypothetical protein
MALNLADLVFLIFSLRIFPNLNALSPEGVNMTLKYQMKGKMKNNKI